MAGVTNNLYPPVIATYMPAFERSKPCRVYFSLSAYNSEEDIKSIHISVCNQKTNQSVLKKYSPASETTPESGYPTGLKIINVSSMLAHLDSTRDSDDKYFIELTNDDLDGGGFAPNETYKVQIRFSSAPAPVDNNGNVIIKLAPYLSQSLAAFSEWSTVCLVKGIDSPKLILKGFEEAIYGNETVFSSDAIDVIGSIDFGESTQEKLVSYRAKVIKYGDSTVLYDTGDLYTDAFGANQINTILKHNFEDGIRYRMLFSYETNNMFTETKEYLFSLIQAAGERIKAEVTAEPDEVEGRIKVNIKTTDRFFGNITIRRSSSVDNFATWQDVYTLVVPDNDYVTLEWYDKTVESGIWYSYCVQHRNSFGSRGVIVEIDKPVMVIFEDMFLTKNETQLKIRYNPQLSSFKRVVLDSTVQTLGSKYPFMRRNGNVSYRQFPIGGLISYNADENEIFITKEEMLGGDTSRYDNVDSLHKEVILERRFREKVEDFLYANDVKLFRSATEGNILVKLTDINFTPEKALGRLIYSFTATATEIDDATFENYEKYGIQVVGNYEKYIVNNYTKVGQLHKKFKAKEDIIQQISKTQNSTMDEGMIAFVDKLTWLKITFRNPNVWDYKKNYYGIIKDEEGNPIKEWVNKYPYSAPRLIETGGTKQIIDRIETEIYDEEGNVTKVEVQEVPRDVYEGFVSYGYEFYLNGERIIVPYRGEETVYELKGDSVEVTSLYFSQITEAEIDYIASVKEMEDSSVMARVLYYYTRVGQLWGKVKYDQDIAKTIYNKYLRNYKEYYQRLTALNKVSIEAPYRSVFFLKDSSHSRYHRFVVGPTGRLNINDSSFSIDSLYCMGILMMQQSDKSEIAVNSKLPETDPDFNASIYIPNLTERDINRPYEFVYHNDNFSYYELTNPKENHVYYITDMPMDAANTPIDIFKNNYSSETTEYMNDLKEYIDNAISEDLKHRFYIWHQNEWHLFVFTQTDKTEGIIVCNVDALIDYQYELVKGEY